MSVQPLEWADQAPSRPSHTARILMQHSYTVIKPILPSGNSQRVHGVQRIGHNHSPAHLYPAMLAMELRESKVWALLSVRGMQSMPAVKHKDCQLHDPVAVASPLHTHKHTSVQEHPPSICSLPSATHDRCPVKTCNCDKRNSGRVM